jgi:high-affinity Fe2+/Pb2+ permease
MYQKPARKHWRTKIASNNEKNIYSPYRRKFPQSSFWNPEKE